MKKITTFIYIIIMLLLISITTYAANGDVAGKIYSTDIKAFINGVEVKSYNIGGKTAVVIEDIIKENSHQYIYDDYTRTLKIFSLNRLVEYKSDEKLKPGKVIGKIYETDIKTSIYDVTIPTYNIGGKTAVAIEDLGNDKEFSQIGGRYVWNEEERTISLEFLYETPKYISYDKNIIITADENMTELTATFEEVLHCGGYQEHFNFPDHVTDDSEIEVVLPINADNAVIGYYFRRPSKTNKFTAFTYYYPDKVEIAEKNYKPYPYTSKEDTISHFMDFHCVGEPRERFDTDRYSFVYISVAGTSWTSYNLIQVFEDGTYIDYGKQIHVTNRSPKNLVIDKEKEIVTFKHVDRYNSEWFTEYEIDLKESKIKAVNNLETDIGIGTSDGRPAETEQEQARSGQCEYKIISGTDEISVNGFLAHEYYYADMLPMAETFEFLNIKYSFENNILTIDSSDAKSYKLVKTDETSDFIGETPIEYLYVDKVWLNGEEAKITYSYVSGHFDYTNQGMAKARPYVCNGIVYINNSFIQQLCE